MNKADGQHIMESRTGTTVVLDGKSYLYFAGTSYFQLHSHPEVIRAANEATSKYGIGSATSRALTGTTPLLEEMEEKLANFFNTEDAVYLPSGYLCSLAGLKALDEMGLFQVIFLDDSSHYSLVEGAAATGKEVIHFRTRDLQDLEDKMKKHLGKAQRPLVASDGLFPVMGTLAPVREYLNMARKFDGVVWIDDAHGVGILGVHGRGSCEALETPASEIYLGATLSKAFGAYGGIVAGNRDFIAKVRSGSVLTGSSAPMHAAVAAGIRGLELVQGNHSLRKQLWNNALYLRESLQHIGIKSETIYIPKIHGTVPIFSFSHRDASTMKKIHNFLLDQGIYTQYTSYKGAGAEGILRVVVSSAHKKVEIVRLTHTLREALHSLKP
ncbi:MAG: pyridoxal phosphate-dependent aminotransferase family protein [Bacteroidales bacterium]|nr:pyridoxal phosphate-dependent aminotransferase family protein [Bacteroidales bacterium]